MNDLLSFPIETCKVCGCTNNTPCHDVEYGACWWVDETETLCSHCADASHENSLKALMLLDEIEKEDSND